MTWVVWAGAVVLMGYVVVLFLLGPRVEDDFVEWTGDDGE